MNNKIFDIEDLKAAFISGFHFSLADSTIGLLNNEFSKFLLNYIKENEQNALEDNKIKNLDNNMYKYIILPTKYLKGGFAFSQLYEYCYEVFNTLEKASVAKIEESIKYSCEFIILKFI